MDGNTQALTKSGWKGHSEVQVGDRVLSLDPITKTINWQRVLSVVRMEFDGHLIHWQNSHGISVLAAPNQQWVVAHRDRNGYTHLDAPARLRSTSDLTASNKQLITGGGIPMAFSTAPCYEDALIELVAWVVTEGTFQKPPALTGVLVAQSPQANPEKAARIRRLMTHFAAKGATATEHRNSHNGMSNFYFGAGIGDVIREVAPDRQLTPAFVTSLLRHQAELVYETLLDADGYRTVPRSSDGYQRTASTENFIQKDLGRVDGYQMLAAMLGRRTCMKEHPIHTGIYNTVTYSRPVTTARHLKDTRVSYKGILWHPRTSTGTWLARRAGGTFWTGELISG